MASMVKANRTNSSALCAPWSTFRLRLLAQFDLWETCRNYTLYWTNIVTATTEKRWRERGGWSGSRAGTSNECRRHLHPGLPVCLRAAYSTKCCSSVSCLSIRILSMLASLLLTGNKPGRGSGSGRGWARTNGTGHLLNMLCPARCASYCELPRLLSRWLRWLTPPRCPSPCNVCRAVRRPFFVWQSVPLLISCQAPAVAAAATAAEAAASRGRYHLTSRASIHPFAHTHTQTRHTHKAQWAREYLWQLRRQSCLSISSW